MDAEIVKAFELVLVFGAVLAVCAWELYSLRRSRNKEGRPRSSVDDATR